MKKMQIFVSSTYEDLKMNAKNGWSNSWCRTYPGRHGDFGGAGTVIGAIKRWIDESDIYFLLLGGMYGSIYEENSEKLVLQNGNTGMHAQSISQSVQLY